MYSSHAVPQISGAGGTSRSANNKLFHRQCAVVSMSGVGPALHFILFDPEENGSDCLSRSHKTKASSLSSFFSAGEVGEIHTFDKQPSS